MQLKMNFKNMKNSRELSEYIEQRFEKIKKYEMKPIQATVTLRVEGQSRRVDIHALGDHKSFQSQGVSGSFFDSIDQAVDRLAKQLMKKKAKVQSHKCFERTHMGKIEKLNDALEHEEVVSSDYDQEAA